MPDSKDAVVLKLMAELSAAKAAFKSAEEAIQRNGQEARNLERARLDAYNRFQAALEAVEEAA